MSDQVKDNKRIKKAYDKEEEFLLDDVVGQGANTNIADKENLKTESEKSLESE